MKPIILPFLAGLLLSSAVVAGVAFVTVSPRLEALRKEWAPTPIVVMASDLRAGESITFDTISQRSIPARFVTDSMVTPAEAHLLTNRPAPIPLQLPRSRWPARGRASCRSRYSRRRARVTLPMTP